MPDIGMGNIEGTPRPGTYGQRVRSWVCGRYSRTGISFSKEPPIPPRGKSTGEREEAASGTRRPLGGLEVMPPDGCPSKQHLSRPTPATLFAVRDDDAAPVDPAFLCSALSNK